MGAASRVDRHETAFSYRDAKWSMVIVGVDPDPANADKITYEEAIESLAWKGRAKAGESHTDQR